jgi:hypothetical protein
MRSVSKRALCNLWELNQRVYHINQLRPCQRELNTGVKKKTKKHLNPKFLSY